ncbi:MAG: glutamine-synthetase adenylyltransferase [Bryobacteraceae bacterium]
MFALSREVALRDQGRTLASLSMLAAAVPEPVFDRLVVLLKACPDPDGAVHYLNRLREEQPAAFQRIMRSPAVLQAAIIVFCYSQFLAEEVLKSPEWIEPIPQAGELQRQRTTDDYRSRLEARLAAIGPEGDAAATLAAFRQEQILRILLRDILGYGALPDVTEELANLADAILGCAYRLLRGALEARHGVPMHAKKPCGLSIIALGKLGGRELNYSSDIDLLFVYGGTGETAGEAPISNQEFFKKLCNQLTEMLSRFTAHGSCYRVDLRLRPEGTLGEVCVSRDGARAYYEKRARAWELQMLIKARVAAGEPGPGAALLEHVQAHIYSSSLDFSAVETVSEARMRIHEKLAKRRSEKTDFDIKLAPGGIRDIEFLVQCLQRLHGGRDPWVRHGSTLIALFRLWNKKLLSEIEYGRLASAYRFFRALEHRLQFWGDRQTHAIPADQTERELLAKRMPPAQIGGVASAVQLDREVTRHLEMVKEIYERVVHTRLPKHYSDRAVDEAESAAARQQAEQAVAALPAVGGTLSLHLMLRLEQRAPGLARTLKQSGVRNGVKSLEHFLESLLPNAEWIGWLDKDAKLAGYVIDLFEHSPYFAEQFNRKPESIADLRQMRLKPKARPRTAGAKSIDSVAEMRRVFHREMLLIQCGSICLSTPIFDTLARTSALAESSIDAAYRFALEQVSESQPPQGKRYKPAKQMMVVALGRLGMQEFDLGSDADLVFVIPDADAPETLFWTRVAERIVGTLTTYTGEGNLFAVDTRLRPNGRAGPLVQTESAVKEYFAKNAEAWEGITYMKSRAVAGNRKRATGFLEALQDVDWRRYGQGGRSKAILRQMRLRLEAEQGAASPLKAGRGGYYDIDFALMYLRLKSAGIFFDVLDTPRRIEVIEKMGHLEPADAEFLLKAATFYRAVDHGLRLISGHAEGKLPGAQLQLEMLSELVSRWTPDDLHDEPLPVELSQIQRQTREYFDRLFS